MGWILGASPSLALESAFQTLSLCRLSEKLMKSCHPFLICVYHLSSAKDENLEPPIFLAWPHSRHIKTFLLSPCPWLSPFLSAQSQLGGGIAMWDQLWWRWWWMFYLSQAVVRFETKIVLVEPTLNSKWLVNISRQSDPINHDIGLLYYTSPSISFLDKSKYASNPKVLVENMMILYSELTSNDW